MYWDLGNVPNYLKQPSTCDLRHPYSLVSKGLGIPGCYSKHWARIGAELRGWLADAWVGGVLLFLEYVFRCYELPRDIISDR